MVTEVLRRQWTPGTRVYSLLSDDGVEDSLHASLAARVGFGARLAIHQAMGECDWVFYGHPSLAQVQRYVPEPFRRPYVMFVHGIEAWRPLTEPEREVYAGAALRLTNSRFTASRVAEENPGLPPLVPCHLALVPSELAAGTAAPETPPASEVGPHAVVVVGRMSAAERYKGHDALLDAWPAIRRRVPDAALVFVGSGDDSARLEARARELGEAGIRFTGFLSAPALDALYRRAAVFALPSRGEGFGLVYLEAMARGVPCIGSVHDAAGEVIADGETGYLVDQGDREAIADRIGSLLIDEPARRAMGARGRARFERSFTFEEFERRFVDAIAGHAPTLLPGRTATAPKAS